jgi:carboxyl-terminal processing protease
MPKSIRYLLTGCIAVVLLLGSFSGGVLVGWLLPDSNVVMGQAETTPAAEFNNETPPVAQSTEELFAPFWEIWDLIHDQYVDQPVNDLALMQGAIEGMLKSLQDDHTTYMDPEQYRQANMAMEGDYEGIGAWVDTTGEYLTIVSPMPNSPAQNAGLKPGDVIIAVDGDDMTGVDGNLVLRRILGPAGTNVTLTVRRESASETIDFTITRAKITIPQVEGKMLEEDIAYIQLYTYGDKTTEGLKKQLQELMAQNPKGMILDLRNNGGGYLHTAIEVVSQFIPNGVVMYEEYGDGRRKEFKALPRGLATEVPLVVLVNEGTASASEITAGAIQDFERGTLVGVTTFGKGSVQNWIPLRSNEGALRVTIARWLTPNERQIHKVGLQPDFVVEMTEEDYDAERDPQLEKAIEILRGK